MFEKKFIFTEISFYEYAQIGCLNGAENNKMSSIFKDWVEYIALTLQNYFAEGVGETKALSYVSSPGGKYSHTTALVTDPTDRP